MILALDIATKCGWATSDEMSGTKDFTQYDDFADVAIAFECWLKDEFSHATQWVIERPFGTGTRAYTVNGMVWTAHKAGRQLDIPRTEIAPSSWRKAVLGNGRAKKADAIKWCQDQGINTIDDNHAEALCILRWAEIALGGSHDLQKKRSC
jgi:hypothetical protein